MKIINDICKILSIVGIDDNILVLPGIAHPTEYYGYARQAITNQILVIYLRFLM
jgi:hypothetical protein